MRFRIVTVFDISQTEGKELPSIGVSELSGNIDRFEELAKRDHKRFAGSHFYMPRRPARPRAALIMSRRKFSSALA